MAKFLSNRRYRYWSVLLITVASLMSSGCVMSTYQAVPARRLPQQWLAPCKNGTEPIDFTLLRQTPPDQFRIGAGDVLGIHIPTILGTVDEKTKNLEPPPYELLPGTGAAADQILTQAAVGHPVHVQHDGTVALPLIAPLSVQGMTLSEAAAAIRHEYVENKKVLKADSGLITVTLIRPRTVRVMVIREDTGGPNPALIRRDTTIVSRRGSAHVLELPAYENDVLHALAQTGGLPGIDGRNEVWVLRNRTPGMQWPSEAEQLQAGASPETLIKTTDSGTELIRIPLRLHPGQPAPFGREDVVLQAGDVVYIESRETEFFYTGGLLEGGKYALPRDHDLDVLAAIATANGKVAGPAGQNAMASNFRNGPGNIIPPSRVLILRTLPSGEQVKIYVNLKVALNDQRERIAIQPDDLVMLQYTGSELLGNVLLNFVTVGYAIPN